MDESITIRQALVIAAKQLQEASVESYTQDARLLLMHAMDISKETLLGYPENLLSPTQYQHYESFIARRAAREPLSHIIGKREFWGRLFKVTSDTLDPRPDSETLIETILTNRPVTSKPLRILDLGTGTGCLLLTLLAEIPESTGIGVDISDKALKVAKHNACKLQLTSRVEFRKGSWAEGLEEKFDIIISNPPYLPTEDIKTLEPEVKQYEPHGALDGGGDGLECYRLIIPEIRRLLERNGVAAVEIGKGQDSDIAAIFKAKGFSDVGMEKDLAGIIRCLWVKE